MRIRRLSAGALISLLVVSLASRGGTAEPPLVADELHVQAAVRGTVRVIVRLNSPFVPEGLLASPIHGQGQRQALSAAQSTVRQHLRGVRHRVAREFGGRLPMMAIEASPEALQMLASLRGVIAAVYEDVPVPLALAQSVPLINADKVWMAGYDGTGQIVAILDTGVQKDHDFFAGGKVIAEACFSTNSFSSSTVCPDGVETSFASGAALPCTVNGCEHGTHVAGIAAGAGPSFSGVAKGARIIAIQVYSRFDSDIDCGGFIGAAPCIKSFPSDQIEALSFVHAQRQTFPGRIAAVNMSLGFSSFAATCDDSFLSPQKLAIDQLRAADPIDPTDPGIATVIAAGNSGFTDAISTPACISSAIPVASSTKGDAVSDFSNFASPGIFPNLLVAPGSSITSSVPPGPATFRVLSGTSMSAPHVAGAFAVLRQASPTASVADLTQALKTSGKPIVDSRPVCAFGCGITGSTASRIDLLGAVAHVGQPDLAVQTLTAPAAGVPGTNISVTTSIRNIGIGPAAASTLKLYLSTDNVITTGDTFLGAVAFNPLNGGVTSPPATVSVPLPSGTAPGSYFLGAIADADAQRDESSETDNTKAVAIQIILPDLVVPSVTVTPLAGGPGMNVSITHSVRNLAAVPANAPASTSGFYLSQDQSFSAVVGARLGTVSVPTVGAGATSPAITASAVTIPGGTPLGRYFVLVRANDAAAFVEGATANNVGASAAPIVLGPDLTATAASTVTAIAPGANVSVMYTLRNLGGQATASFDVAFVLVPQSGGPERPIGPGRTVAGLGAGAMLTFTNLLSIPPDAPAGAYRIRVITDSGDTVPEADETNNTVLTGLLNVVQADLTVPSTTFAPPATRPGGSVTVTHVVKNTAPVPGHAGPSSSRLRLSSNQSVGGAVADFGPVGVPSIAAGAMATVSKLVSIPADTAPGLYYVLASADDAGTIFEINEGNNLGVSQTRIIVGPDVLPTAATTLAAIAPGRNLSVSYTLRNQGGATAGPFDVAFAIVPVDGSGTPIGPEVPLGPRRSAVTIPAGGTAALSTTVVVPSFVSGPHRVRIIVDPGAVLVEADTTNNTILTAGTLTVVRPDLIVPPFTFSPPTSAPGDVVTVQYSVKNQALPPGDAGPFLSRLFLSLNQITVSEVKDLGLRAVPAIKAASTVSVTRLVTLPADLAPGRYYFGTEANPAGVVLENNDGNNVGFSQTRILVGPDIVPTAATTSAGVATGMNASVSYTLRNQGGQVASSFNVAFALVPVSAAGVPTGADIPIGDARTGITLGPGATLSLVNVLAIPDVTTSGHYRIRIIADPDDRVPEADETNNTLLTAGTLSAVRPDLAVQSVAVTPGVATLGTVLSVTHVLKNLAPVPGTAKPTTTRLFLSTTPSLPVEAPPGSPAQPAPLTFVAAPVPSIPGGGAATVKTLLPVPSLAPGKYWVVAQANALGSIVEADSPTQANDVGATLAPILVGPDLVVTAATAAPLALAPGFNVSVTSTVKNQGGAAAGPFDVGIYLSTDAVLAAGDTLLATRRVTGGLAPGAVSSATTPVTIPAGQLAGDYVLIVRADVALTDGEVAEADEANNNLPTPALKVVRPDLVMQSVTATPALLAPGANVSVTQVIKNIAPPSGTASATMSRLYLSDVPSSIEAVTKPVIGDVPVPPIAGAAMASITRSVQIPPGTVPGKYWIYARANTVDPIAEAEGPEQINNLQRTDKPIVVGPDLILTALTVPALASPNLTIPITTTVKNQGGQGTNGSVVRFFLSLSSVLDGSEIAVGVTSTAALAPGGAFTTTSRITLPATASAGARFLLAQADSGAPEADLTNNTLSRSFTLDRPNLEILSITAPAAVIRGRVTGAPSASVVVKNTGVSPSAPFDVQVFANRDNGTASAAVAGSGDLLFTRTVAALAPGASVTVSGPVVIEEVVSGAVRLAGNYFVSALADPSGAATGDASLGGNAVTLLSKRLAVLPDIARLHTATVGLTRDPACGATTLNLQGPFSVTNQNVANPSSFAGKVTLDDVGAGVHVVYTVSGTVRAVDGGGTAGAITWTFTYSGDGSGSGTITGAAAGLELVGGVISGRRSGVPTCTFSGTFDVAR